MIYMTQNCIGLQSGKGSPREGRDEAETIPRAHTKAAREIYFPPMVIIFQRKNSNDAHIN